MRLGLTWNDKISFVLTEHLQIKRLVLLNVINQEAAAEIDNEKEQFELDFALMTGELALMIDNLIEALGGEKEKS